MITIDDIKKMKAVFATKEDLKALRKEFVNKFATKDDLKSLDSKMNNGFGEIIEFIGEVKNDIMKELGEFRNEMRDINRNNQSVLNNHEVRIAHLELK